MLSEPWFVRIRPGVFLSWTDDGPQLCHVDKPLDVFAVSADMVRLIVRLDAETPVDEALADLEVPAEVHQAVREALRTLIEAGMLTDVHGTEESAVRGDVPLRDTGQEAARRILAHPDIEKLDPDFLTLYRSLNRSTLTSVPLAYALHQAVRYVVRADLHGSIVECGVWRGGSMALAATVLASLGDVRRELWLYDTFDWH